MDVRSLAADATVWGSALVASTRLRQMGTRPDDPFAVRPASSPAAPLNNLGHQRKLSDPHLAGVAPNVDTLYSLAWLDTDEAPFVLETPDFGDRYYSFQIGYANTECELCPGQRTHGPQLPPLFIHGPTYVGAVPDGMLPVASPTRYLMIAARILVLPENPDDLMAVRRLQQQIRLRSLPRWERGETGANPVSAQRPLPGPADVGDPDLLFLHQLGCVLGEGVVSPEEHDLVESFRPLGLRPGGGFDADTITETERIEIVAGLRDGDALVEEKIGSLGHGANGWSVNLQGSQFGDDYLLRAAVAKNQIYVVPADEAVYPVARIDGNGDPLDGRHRYRLLLEPPPTDSFWSLTVYGTPGPLVANRLNRYAIGDRTPGLEWQQDGGLSIVLQHADPIGSIANWLPAPAGPFHLMMRLYWPQRAVLEGRWHPPPIERIDDNTHPEKGSST
jgi:hypothetical protein